MEELENNFEGYIDFSGDEEDQFNSGTLDFDNISEVPVTEEKDEVSVDAIEEESDNVDSNNGVIGYKDFHSLCLNDSGISVHNLYKYVVNYFINNRNQIMPSSIETEGAFVDNDLLSCFDRFSVIDKVGFKTIDKYIVFINPNEVEDSYYEEVEKNLPNNTLPTHVCILSNDIPVIEESFKTLLNINPNLVLVNYTSTYNISKQLNANAYARISKYPTFCVAEYCSELSKIYGPMNDYTFYKRFDEVVSEILELGKGKVVYFGGDYSNMDLEIYKLIVIECSLRNMNFKFYIEDEYVKGVATSISNCMFDPDNQLVEDTIHFIKHFPRIFSEYKTNYLVRNTLTGLKVIAKLTYVPISNIDKSEVRTSKVDVTKLNVIPLKTYFNLESDDINSNIEQELELRLFIYGLYDVFGSKLGQDIINLTNLVFFELDGKEYIGYNSGYDVSLNCNSIMNGLPATERKITDIDAFKSFVYSTMFLDRSLLLQYKTVEEVNGELREKVNALSPSAAMVKNITRKNLSIFKYTACVYTSEMMEFPNALYLLGMCSKESRLFRENASKRLTDILGLDSVRKKVDSFGGFNSITNKVIEV